MKRLISLLLSIVLIIGSTLSFPAATTAAAKTRDTVLLLDTSGSMDGTPLEKLMEAANSFCDSVLNAEGTNRIAIVTYDTYANLECEFTGNLQELKSCINSMYSDGSTNMYDPLQIASEQLGKSSAQIKNIVLMSDGMPCDGEYTTSGPYTPSDYDGYDYANAVYQLAKSLPSEYSIYTIGFFHELYDEEKAFARRFMQDLQTGGYYEAQDVEDIHFAFGNVADSISEVTQKGTFKYPNGAKDYEAEYYYTDQYFYDSSFLQYNPSLSTMSLCLAMSAFGSGDVNEYYQKSQNVYDLMANLGFENIEVTSSFQEKPGPDTIAAAIAEKTIADNSGKTYTLLAVAVRGGGYEQEWASNFTIGKTGNHTGFTEAANQVIEFIQNYIVANQDDTLPDIKLWITGYSRAAATANMVAGALDQGTSLGDSVTLDKEDLYAYCFETPAGTTDMDANNLSVYGNIYNIINPNDLVTKVAPTAMGFRRYGYDKVLPTYENKYNGYSAATEKMLKQFDQLESVSYDDYVLNQFVYKKFDPTHLRVMLSWEKSGISWEPVYDADEQMSMSAFLDDFFSQLVYGFISRNLFYSQIQEGVRELCKALFIDESKQGDIFKSLGDKLMANLGKLVWLLAWDIDGALDFVVEQLADSIRENGITDFSDSEIKRAAKPLIERLVVCLALNPNAVATFVNNKDYFFTAHYPELCLAWMQSMDPNYTTDAGLAFSNGAYRIIRINCPVDVTIRDSMGNTVASIINDEAVIPDGSSIFTVINSDGEKVAYLPADEDFDVEITGTDAGDVDYSVNEFCYSLGQVNRLVNYYDVPIETGKSINAVVPAYDESYLDSSTENATTTNYTLTDMEGNTLTPDLNVSGEAALKSYCTVTVQPDKEEHGSVSGGGSKPAGSYMQISAYPNEGYSFKGWYVDDELISSEMDYRLSVTEDMTIVAKFESNGPSTGMIIIIVSVSLFVVLLIILIIVLARKKSKNNKREAVAGVGSPPAVLPSGSTTAPFNGQNIPIVRKPAPGNYTPPSHAEKPQQAKHTISLRIAGSDKSVHYSFDDKHSLKVGKDPKWADVVIPVKYEKVSRKHCEISFDSNSKQYIVKDMSMNGTFTSGGKKISGVAKLAPGTTIMLVNKDCRIVLK